MKDKILKTTLYLIVICFIVSVGAFVFNSLILNFSIVSKIHSIQGRFLSTINALLIAAVLFGILFLVYRIIDNFYNMVPLIITYIIVFIIFVIVCFSLKQASFLFNFYAPGGAALLALIINI